MQSNILLLYVKAVVWTKLLKHAILLAKQAFAWLNLKGLISCLFCVSIMNIKISFCAKTEVRTCNNLENYLFAIMQRY